MCSPQTKTAAFSSADLREILSGLERPITSTWTCWQAS